VFAFNDCQIECRDQLILAHGDICNAVRQRHLMSADLEQITHSVMAMYFYSLADPSFDRSWSGKSVMAFAQLPYHLVSPIHAHPFYSLMAVEFSGLFCWVP
jgi:hypothetical protein